MVGTAIGIVLLLFVERWQSLPRANNVSGPMTGLAQALVTSVGSSNTAIAVHTNPSDDQNRVYFQDATSSAVLAHVSRDVDGDTVVANISSTGQQVKIRFLAMNTPESVDPRRPVQCFGHEASAYTKSLIEGKDVLLVDDPQADDVDKYGRLLRTIVRVSDGLDVNATLVAQGYAYSYLSFPLNAKRKAFIRGLEEDARSHERGLWNPTTCNGQK